MAGPFFGGNFFGGGFFQQGYYPPTGGSGGNYRTHTDWDKQKAKSRKRLLAQVESIQKKIEKQKKKLEYKEELSTEKLDALSKKLRELQELLLRFLSELDELNKAYYEAEKQEVIAIYLAYRSIH